MSSLIWQQLNFKNSALKIFYGIIGSESGIMPEHLLFLFCGQQGGNSDVGLFYPDCEDRLSEL